MSLEPEQPAPSALTRLGFALLAPLLFIVAAAALRTHWSRVDTYGTTGDEPKYLAMGKALWMRHAIQVRTIDIRAFTAHHKHFLTAHARDAALAGHSYFTNHGLGLPALIGPGIWLHGVPGARALMAVIALAIPVVVYFVLRAEGCTPGTSALFATALGVSAPLLAHSTQIYPDLPGGVIAAAALLVLLRRERRACAESTGVHYFVLASVALMPWLELRFLPAGLILTAALILFGRPWKLRTATVEALPAVAAIVILLAYNRFAIGAISGTHRANDQNLRFDWESFLRFLGLNVDRFQGMFVQQPLLLLAIPGVVLLLRRSRALALVTVGTYFAFVVPTALHPNWFGGASFAGRFGLSAAIALLVPAGVALAAAACRFPIPTRVLGVAAIGLNVWQYQRVWRGDLPLLGQPPTEPRALYSSWLPLLGRSLPAFNRVRWGGAFAPNYVVPIAFVALIVGCALLFSTRKRVGVAIVAVSLAAFVFPIASARPTEKQEVVVFAAGDTGRHRPGGFDAEAGHDKRGLLATGPVLSISDQSDWAVTMRYSSPAPPAVVVGRIAATTGRTRWCVLRLRGTNGHEQRVDLSWRHRKTARAVQFPVLFTGRASLHLSSVAIWPGPGADDALQCPAPRSQRGR